MLVISDTSCLSALIQTRHLHLLKNLYESITIPTVVYDELAVLADFGIDISMLQESNWLKIQTPIDTVLVEKLMLDLHEGEAQAIALAIELHADLIIVDDYEARKTATNLGLHITGLGGVLLEAKKQSFIKEVKPLLDQIIESAGFYLSAQVYNRILQFAGESN
jgi:uncharacterized protein